MTICNKFLASFFFSLALLCLCICPVASGGQYNAFGYWQISYDELDELWGEFYEDHSGEIWPGLSDYLNNHSDRIYCFRSPHPFIIGRYDTQNESFSATNGFLFTSLSPHRNFVVDLGGNLRAINQEVPDYFMLQIADQYNLVDSAVESLANIPNTATNDLNFPWRLRSAQVMGMNSHWVARASALLFQGISVEVKTVPYPWSGFWAGWAVSVCELIDNGVNPSFFGSWADYCDEQNIAWVTETRSIFDAFSNITLRVSHRWESAQDANE